MITPTPDPSDLQLTPAIATGAEECWRCADLGLRPFAWIPAGEAMVTVQSPNGRLHACADCYARVYEEVEEGGPVK